MYKETQPYGIESVTADSWLSIGTIWPIWYGNENTYYMDQFDREYFSKNYPDLYGDPDYSYQHNDGSTDYAPYGKGVWSQVMEAFENNNDYQIMLTRVKASKRGATPVEVQVNVNRLSD